MVVKERILKSVGRSRLIMYRESRPLLTLASLMNEDELHSLPLQSKSARISHSLLAPHTMLCLLHVSHLV